MELIKDLTIGKLLAETVEKYGDRPAVAYLGQRWTYHQLDVLSDQIALGMLAMGIHKGSKAGIWANDRPDTLFCFLALEKIGAVPVMLNTSWTVQEVQVRLLESKVMYLFYDEGYRGLDFVDVCRQGLVSVPGTAVYISDAKWPELPENLGALEEAKAAVCSEDTDMILFTSGSTGAPRGVLTTHFSRSNNARAQADMIRADLRDVFLVAIPMFHCFSMSGNILAAIAVGACICFPKSRRTDHLLAAIERAQVTVLTAVPTLFSALLANERRKQYKTSSLRTGLVGGAGCSQTLFEAICREFHMDLLPSLGQTEATAGITAGCYEDNIKLRVGTVGRAIEHLKLRIVKIETGEILPDGENGELCVRGYTVMQGYDGHPQLTALTIDTEGFLHTGDLGYLDTAGRLHLTGRKKELIIRGGENIAPGEIEGLLLADGRILEAKVIGIPDDHYGEEVCACVVCKGGERPEAEEIRQLVGNVLAYYKVPRYVVFLEKMPILGNGKVDIQKLKELVNL